MATKKKAASSKGPNVTIKVSGNPKMEESNKFETIYQIKAAKNLTNYTAAVNGEPVDDSYELVDGDWISFSPEVKGGATVTVESAATKATARYFKANPMKTKKKVANKGKAAEIAQILRETDFGCRREGVRKLMEIATGQKIALESAREENFSAPPAVAVVVIVKGSEPNGSGHGQNLGTVLLSIGKQSFSTPSGGTVCVFGHEVRPAKASEIRKLTKAQIERFGQSVIII